MNYPEVTAEHTILDFDRPGIRSGDKHYPSPDKKKETPPPQNWPGTDKKVVVGK